MNVQIEAGMLALHVERPENFTFTLPELLREFDCETEEDLKRYVLDFVGSTKYSLDRYLVDAERRAEYDKKAKFFFEKGDGFPIDVELMQQIYSKGNDIARHACHLANQVANVFVERQNITVDGAALRTVLEREGFYSDGSVSELISQLKEHPRFGIVYIAYRTLQAFSGKSLELPKLVKNGYMKGGFRTFQQKTGRTTPKPTEGFILNMHPWMRHLVKPKPGRAFIAFDWVGQESWIQAVLTGDEKLMAAYKSGDIYAAIGRELGVIPVGGTKATHPEERRVAKVMQLSLSYGKGRDRISKELPNGGALFDAHKHKFSTFWSFMNKFAEDAQHRGYFTTRDGWLYLTGNTSKHVLLNAPIQSEAAGLLRKTVMLLPEDVDLACTLHDALYVNCAIEEIDATVARVTEIMNRAAMEYFNVDHAPGVEVKVFTDRFEDDRGQAFFESALEIVAENKNVPRLPSFVMNLKEKVEEELEITRPEERTFTEPLSYKERERHIQKFLAQASGKQVSVLCTREGFGKSTQLVKLLNEHKPILFCCLSNEQVKSKMVDFTEFKPKRAISGRAHFEELTGLKCVIKKKTWEHDEPDVDWDRTAELLAEHEKCDITDATNAILTIREEARHTQELRDGLVITTFALGNVLFNNSKGKLGKDWVIIVDDPGLSNFALAKFDLTDDGVQVIEGTERTKEDLLFRKSFTEIVEIEGQEVEVFLPRTPVIFTTTEKLTVQAIEDKYDDVFVYEVVENLATKDTALKIMVTNLANKNLRAIVPGVNNLVATELKTEAPTVIANGIGEEFNLVNNKGRNDLTGDLVVVLGTPHPLELAMAASACGVDVEMRNLLKAQFVIDQANQAMRNMGYRYKGGSTLILCPSETWKVSLQWGMNYQVHDMIQDRPRGSWKGLPLLIFSDNALWIRWSAYVRTWQQHVFIDYSQPGKATVYNDLMQQELILTKFQFEALKDELHKPLPKGALKWKQITEVAVGEAPDRRNYRMNLEVLLAEANQEVASRPGNKGRKQKKNPDIGFMGKTKDGQKRRFKLGDIVPPGFEFDPRQKLTVKSGRLAKKSG